MRIRIKAECTISKTGGAARTLATGQELESTEMLGGAEIVTYLHEGLYEVVDQHEEWRGLPLEDDTPEEE